MAMRQRNRTAAVDHDSGEIRDEWFTVETEDGVAVGGLDNVFDFESEQEALRVVKNLVVEAGRPLTVVGYTRAELGTYQAVMKIEEVRKD